MTALAYVDDGEPIRAGTLYPSVRRGRLSTTFHYEADHLGAPRAYALEPALPLTAGAWPEPAGLPRSIRDAAPDRWGRNLIARRAAYDGAGPHRWGARAPRRRFETPAGS